VPVTFVLVPGAWLGAWCWASVARVLTAAGARVRAVDLDAGDGDARSFGRQVAAVHNASACAGGVVVLVGHSHGGSVVTAATQRTLSGAVMVIFLDGAMPQSGMSTADTWPPGMRDGLAAGVGADGMLPPPGRAELPEIPAADFGRLRPLPVVGAVHPGAGRRRESEQPVPGRPAFSSWAPSRATSSRISGSGRSWANSSLSVGVALDWLVASRHPGRRI
jgi:pimeloyl-ACP methyl ester carboxylesterase